MSPSNFLEKNYQRCSSGAHASNRKESNVDTVFALLKPVAIAAPAQQNPITIAASVFAPPELNSADEIAPIKYTAKADIYLLRKNTRVDNILSNLVPETDIYIFLSPTTKTLSHACHALKSLQNIPSVTSISTPSPDISIKNPDDAVLTKVHPSPVTVTASPVTFLTGNAHACVNIEIYP